MVSAISVGGHLTSVSSGHRLLSLRSIICLSSSLLERRRKLEGGRAAEEAASASDGFAADGVAPRPVKRCHPHLLQDHPNHRRAEDADPAVAASQLRTCGGGVSVGADWIEAGHHAGGVAPPGGGGGGGGRGRRRKSGGFEVAQTASFLMACGLCKRRLGNGGDTFMCRGDTAFCSLECRQQHINQVELKEKCSLTSMKDAQVTKMTEKSDNGESSIAAA